MITSVRIGVDLYYVDFDAKGHEEFHVSSEASEARAFFINLIKKLHYSYDATPPPLIDLVQDIYYYGIPWLNGTVRLGKVHLDGYVEDDKLYINNSEGPVEICQLDLGLDETHIIEALSGKI